jgi:DNA repair ATPase RecN
MKPSVQKIITKLAKEQENNLEKVELGIAQEYASAAMDALQSLEDAENLVKTLKSVQNKADAAFKSLSKAENKIVSIAQKMISKVKELGIDENSLPEIKKSRQLQKKISSIRQDLLQVIK